MAESGLSQGYPDYRKEAARKLGYSLTQSEWTTDQTDRINYAVKAGTQMFTYPTFNGKVHKWSFLYPVDDVDTVSGTEDYTMDDNFGGIWGPLVFDEDDGYWPIKIIDPFDIRQKRTTAVSGKPQYAAIEPNAQDQSEGIRYTLMLWPNPDAVYTLRFRKCVIPKLLSDTNLYMPGGAQHSLAQMQCVRAAAEREKNNEWGREYAMALEFLKTAISNDQGQEPEFYGSMNKRRHGHPFHNVSDGFTYNGVQVSDINP